MAIRVYLLILFTGVLLYLAFHDINFISIFHIFTAIKYQYFIVAVGLDLLIFSIKSLKWRYIFLPIKKIGFQSFFSGIAVGAMANNLLPVRSDEIVRTFYFGWKTGIRGTVVFGTVIIERLVDIFTLAAVCTILVVLFSGETWVIKSSLMVLIVFFGMAGIVLFSVKLQRSILTALHKVFPESFRRLRIKTENIYSGIIVGLKAFPSPKRLPVLFLFSLLEWLVFMLYLRAVLTAFGIDVPLLRGYLLLAAVNYLSSAIPSVPGAIGVFEFLVKHAIIIAATVNADTAISFTLVLHFMLLAPISLLGFIFLIKDGISFSRLYAISKAAASTKK